MRLDFSVFPHLTRLIIRGGKLPSHHVPSACGIDSLRHLEYCEIDAEGVCPDWLAALLRSYLSWISSISGMSGRMCGHKLVSVAEKIVRRFRAIELDKK